MELKAIPNAVTDISSEQLRELLESRSSVEYVIVDVRQPEEFKESHIPGAKLIPVGEFAERASELPRSANVVFYCTSGGERSQRAAQVALNDEGFAKVFRLVGGLAAWTDAKIPGLSSIKALDLGDEPTAVLRSAMNLEKGAERFYLALSQQLKGTVAGPLMVSLAGAEEGHAQEIYDMLIDLGAEPEQSFEDLYASLAGDLLESGETYEEVVQRALKDEELGPVALLELALGMEYRAQDLYSSLLRHQTKPELRAQLQDLVDQEKGHANQLLKGIGMLAEAFEDGVARGG